MIWMEDDEGRRSACGVGHLALTLRKNPRKKRWWMNVFCPNEKTAKCPWGTDTVGRDTSLSNGEDAEGSAM